MKKLKKVPNNLLFIRGGVVVVNTLKSFSFYGFYYYLVTVLILPMMMIPNYHLWSQGIIESEFFPKGVQTSVTLTENFLVMPGCEQMGFSALEVIPSGIEETIINPNYDPNDFSETTFRNSYLLVATTFTPVDPGIEFFELVVTDVIPAEITDKHEAELLGTKELTVSGSTGVKFYANFFKVVQEISIPNTVEDLSGVFALSKKEVRFYQEDLDEMGVSLSWKFEIRSGSLTNFDIENFEHKDDLEDFPVLGESFFNFSAMKHILIDGTVTPQYLSNYVNSELWPSGGEYLLAHPDVACLQETGEGINSVLMVEGDLIVDIDYCYMNDVNNKHSDPEPFSEEAGKYKYIYMGPDSRIIIESGVEFTIDRTIILSCNTLWNSIVVEDGGTLNIRNSYIKDGIHAIHVEPGGSLNAHRNIFDANHVSIYTPPNSGSGRYSINVGPFYGNDFVNNSEMYPYPTGYSGFETDQPFAGIQVNDLMQFTAGGVGPDEKIFPNTFVDIPLGIYAINSGIFIANYSISNAEVTDGYGGIGILLEQSTAVPSRIKGNGKNSGVANINNAELAGIVMDNGFNTVVDNVITNSPIGIRLTQTGLSVNAIGYNNISASEYGILHNSVAGGLLNILDNEITMNRETQPSGGDENSGIGLFGLGYSGTGNRFIQDNTIALQGNSQRGIYISSVNNARIRENSITDEEGNNYFVGLNLIESPFALVDYNSVDMQSLASEVTSSILQENSHSTRMNCNSTSRSEVRIQVIGSNDNSELKGNDIGVHGINGLLYGYIGQNPQSIPHITGLQPHHGNLWDASYTTSLLGARHMNSLNIDVFQSSRFFVDPNENANFLTTRFPLTWFEPQMHGNSWSCPGSMPSDPWYDFTPLPSPTDWDEKLVLDFEIFDDNPYYDSWEYVSKRNLYERISEGWYHSSALNSTALDSFLQTMENSNIVALHNVRRSMTEAMNLTESQWLVVETKADSISDRVDALFALDSLAWADTTSVDTAQWLSDRAEILETLGQIQSNLDGYVAANSSDKGTVAAQAQSTLNGLSSENDPENYEIQMLGLIAETVFQGDWDLSQQQQLTVEEIADYCPAEGGPSVYWARNIRQVYDPGIVYNDTLCQAESGHRLAREMESTKGDIKLYPNPASSEISVDLSDMDFDRWVIYSMDGKPMVEGRINSNEVLNIPTSGMKSGQYILKLGGKDPTHIVSFIILNPNR